MGGVVGGVGDFCVLLVGGVFLLLVRLAGDGRVGENLAVLLLLLLPLLLLSVVPLQPKLLAMGELGLF